MPAIAHPPFRADHVGSLLRPPELKEARLAFEDGRLPADELRDMEDDAIASVVELQESIGLKSVTDGEFRRASWHLDFLFKVKGVEKSPHTRTIEFRVGDKVVPYVFAPMRIVGRLELEETIFAREFQYLKSLTKVTPKLSIPAPSMLHVQGGPEAVDPDAYPHRREFYEAIAPIYREEIAGLAALGCEYLQLDDTRIPFLTDPDQRKMVEELGEDPKQNLDMYIEHINDALEGRPPGMRITTHMCRGNFRSAWAATGSYDYIADTLFGRLNVDAFFLEFDDERSGGFEPLRYVPRDKMVVLGLVSTKTPELESKDLLKRRIEEACEFLELDQICLSPQCGFSSTIDGNALSVEEQAAKLRLVVEVAEEIWGDA